MSAQTKPSDDEQSPCILGVENSARGRTWLPRVQDDRAALALAQGLGLPEIIGRVLAGRGVTLDAAQTYLNPSLRALLPDPSTLQDMDKAAARIVTAIRDSEPLAIFGDYDVDGATSCAVLARFFQSLGQEPLIYIPDRALEGYGPNKAAFESFVQSGITLAITVDCGTLAFEPLAQAKALGLDVIVVDHHQAEVRLPDAVAVINPNRQDDLSRCGQLAAVGVAFLLAIAVNRQLRQEGWYDEAGITPLDLMSLLDIVALGTVCDVVPLTGVNRAFVTQGLKVMEKRANLGIATLSDIAKVKGAPGTYELGFVFGPRVNAGGRVGRSDLGSRLLTTHDDSVATSIALDLDHMNKERRTIESMVLDQVMGEIATRLAKEEKPAILVIAGHGWHEGVIGIVASRVKDRYGVPAIVIALGENGLGKGSGRSIPGVDLGVAVVAALNADLLVSGGGHPMAAGLTVPNDGVAALEDFLCQHLGAQVTSAGSKAISKLDGVLAAGGATRHLCGLLEKAGPYGAGNPEPVFAFAHMHLVHVKVVGESHVSCVFSGPDGNRLRAIAFRCADQPLGELLLGSKGQSLHVCGRLSPDTWRGGEAVQLTLSDAAAPALGG